MIKFEITSKGVGESTEVSIEGDIKGSDDVIAMEIWALLDNLEESCPLSFMTAIRSKISEEGL